MKYKAQKSIDDIFNFFWQFVNVTSPNKIVCIN